MTLQQPPAPGWYNLPDGSTQWWNGQSWVAPAIAPPLTSPGTVRSTDLALQPPQGALAPTEPWRQTTVVHHVHFAQKEVGTAYLFAILLGGFAAHRFYLGRPASAIAMLLMWQIGVATAWMGVGLLLVVPTVIWFVVDLCVLKGMVHEENAKRYAAAAAQTRGFVR